MSTIQPRQLARENPIKIHGKEDVITQRNVARTGDRQRGSVELCAALRVLCGVDGVCGVERLDDGGGVVPFQYIVESEGFLGGWEGAGLGGDSGDYLEVFFGSREGGDFEGGEVGHVGWCGPLCVFGFGFGVEAGVGWRRRRSGEGDGVGDCCGGS